MKKLNKLVIALLITLVSPIIVKAVGNLTIDEKSYDKDTYEFVVSGTSDYAEVMVSLFDGDDLLSFKTVTANNNEYTATFDITFEQDKTVTIKVGDINSEDYEIDTLDVEKSEIHLNNILTDEEGNQLIIKGTNKEFRERERLNINIYSMEDIEEMLEAVKGTEQEEEFTEGFNMLKLALGNKEMLSYIEVNVEDNGTVDYSSHMSGFTLKLKLDKETYAALGDFEIAHVNEETGKLENALEYTYDEENEMLVMNIDKLGRFMAYVKPEETTDAKATSPQTGDSIMKDVLVLGISITGFAVAALLLKKNKNSLV